MYDLILDTGRVGTSETEKDTNEYHGRGIGKRDSQIRRELPQRMFWTGTHMEEIQKITSYILQRIGDRLFTRGSPELDVPEDNHNT